MTKADEVKKVFALSEFEKGEEVDLYRDYTHIRAFHACRPLKIETYLSEGIKPISKKEILHEALERIKSKYVPEAKIIKQFNIDWQNLDDIHKRVWLNLNKEILLTGASHYLIYGSEFLNALAMKLGCRDCLKNAGIPTVFQCDIPIEDINPKTIFDIQNVLMGDYFDDIGISIDMVLPENIVDYEHPTRELPDVYNYPFSYKADYKKLAENGFKD